MRTAQPIKKRRRTTSSIKSGDMCGRFDFSKAQAPEK